MTSKSDYTHEELREIMHGGHAFQFSHFLDTELSEQDVNSGVNDFHKDDGYFGRYMPVKYKGKYTVLLYSRRAGSGCTARCGWYDEIIYDRGYKTTWDADYRWNSDRPLMVRLGDKWNLIDHYGKELCDEWLDYIGMAWVTNKAITKEPFITAILNRKQCCVLPSGAIIDANYSQEEELQKANEMGAKAWVDNGMPCTLVHGLWNGSHGGALIANDLAKDLLPIYTGGFREKKFVFASNIGKVVLQFIEYSESDMW